MFNNASLRLTAWYVAILMALSLAFSIWVYNQAAQELRAGLKGPLIVQFQDRLGGVSQKAVQEAIEQQFAISQGRIAFNLVLLNLGVLLIGGGASYWLARRTLSPIEESLEAQNRFTADASHELRTPLAAMKTEIEVALRDPKLSKADMQELLGSNLEEIDRMSDLAQGLLTLARSDAAPQLTAVQANKIVEEIAARLQPLADAKRITIKKELPELRLMAEPKSLAAIVGILLDNTIKYSSEGTTITLTTQRQDGHGLIKVTDQGVGIKAADLPHIFDRFYRADSSRTKEKVAGHGLGLSIAHKLIGLLRGTITAQSAPGAGSTFTLRLPVVQ